MDRLEYRKTTANGHYAKLKKGNRTNSAFVFAITKANAKKTKRVLFSQHSIELNKYEYRNNN
jgi:Zn/Cd-binding protein ZinT